MLRQNQFLAPDGSGGSGGAGGASETDANQVQNPPTTPAPSTDIGEWEKKYKGLQTLVNKLNGEKEKLNTDLTTALATIEEQKVKITGLEGQVAKLTTDLTAEKKNVETAKSEGAGKASEAARLKLILKEFPQLAPFEVAGALPAAATEEEMRTRFTAFGTALSSVVGQGVQKKLEGASFPADTSKPTEPTVDSLYEQMVKIAGIPSKREEYAKLQVQYDALLAAQNAKKS